MEKKTNSFNIGIGVVMTLIIITIGYLFNVNTVLSERITAVSSHYTKIETQLSQIQTDLTWLKQVVKVRNNY